MNDELKEKVRTLLLQGSKIEAIKIYREGSVAAILKRRRSESNRRIKVLQTSALPLGYAAVSWLYGEIRMERETGFEPATSTLARLHSTTELFPPE